MIYLDNAATTRPFNEVIELVNEVNSNLFFNPSALFSSAISVKDKISSAREAIAKILKVSGSEIYFTSGATEANNWALFCGYKNRKGNIVVSEGEHHSIYEPAKHLKSLGLEVRFSPLNNDGTINETEFLRLIDENTLFISVIHRSNETGAVNDIFRLCKIAKNINKNVIFHSDGAQAFCKIAQEKSFKDIDLYSISGHKIKATKGIGALYVNKNNKIRPMILGGGQEFGMRSGTENVAGILGMAKAAELYAQRLDINANIAINDFIASSLSELEDVKINTFDCASNIISVSIKGVRAEVLLRLLDKEGILIGLGSACASKLRTNRVLSLMKVPSDYIDGSIRISFGIDTKLDEVKFAVEKMKKLIKDLRSCNIG